jgi:hypothetical protein
MPYIKALCFFVPIVLFLILWFHPRIERIRDTENIILVGVFLSLTNTLVFLSIIAAEKVNGLFLLPILITISFLGLIEYIRHSPDWMIDE